MKKSYSKYEKKIIFFCPAIDIGGVEKNFFKIVNFFSFKKNEDISIITFDKKKGKKDLTKILNLLVRIS